MSLSYQFAEHTIASTFPSAAAWTDHGTVIAHGAADETDWVMRGTPHPTITKFAGNWIIYTCSGDSGSGANGTGDARNRRLHASTCPVTSDPTDVGNWSKQGVVREWFPAAGNSPEEGMSSPVVYLKGDLMYLFYSALSDPNPPDSGSVTAGMRRMKSYDGLTFDDDQEVFAFDETGLAGSGDEIYPAYVGLDSDRTPVMIYHTDGFAVYQLSGTDIHTWTVATSSLELAAGENRWWSNFVKTPGGDTGFLLCSHGSDDEFEIYACDQSDFAALNGVTPTTQAFSALGLYLHATVWREYNRYLAVGYDGDTNPDISIKLLSIGDW